MILYFRGDNAELASRLKHRIRLEETVETPDGLGGTTRAWKLVAELWAEVTAISGREQLFAMRLQNSVSHRVVMRYREGVTPGMRVNFGERVFNIRSIVNHRESNEMLELLVEEGVAT